MSNRAECETCAIRDKALCCALSPEEMARLNQTSRHRKLAAGQVILREGEEPDSFANIVSGVVKLTKTMSDGRLQIVGLQFASDFLGRPFGVRSPYTAEAATEVQLCSFTKSSFEILMREFPGIEHRLFERALNELDSAREWMMLLGRKTAAEKVASFLLLVARRSLQSDRMQSGATREITFNLPLTRSEISDYLGLTIETVSRQITRLKSEGIIRLQRARIITIPDLGKLSREAAIDG